MEIGNFEDAHQTVVYQPAGELLSSLFSPLYNPPPPPLLGQWGAFKNQKNLWGGGGKGGKGFYPG